MAAHVRLGADLYVARVPGPIQTDASSLKMILVTGANGFLGRVLKLELNARQFDVRGALRSKAEAGEVNVGDISCPSCHNAHQWSPFSRRTTAPQNQADNDNGVDKFRFLRNMSTDLVCIDCHGTQALYRYLYFHSPDKREKMKFIPAHQAFQRRSIF